MQNKYGWFFQLAIFFVLGDTEVPIESNFGWEFTFHAPLNEPMMIYFSYIKKFSFPICEYGRGRFSFEILLFSRCSFIVLRIFYTMAVIGKMKN